MKVLLINPFSPLMELPSLPLGISGLATSLREAGVEVRLYDLAVSRYDEHKLEAVVGDFRPDAIAATAATMDVDVPMPVREVLPLGRYRALDKPIRVTSNRSCSLHGMACRGCSTGGAELRIRGPERVVDEMEALERLGFAQLDLTDVELAADPAYSHALCDEIRRRGLRVSWSSFADVGRIDSTLLRRMRETGYRSTLVPSDECERHARAERTAIYYDVMMNDVLETHGSFATRHDTVSPSHAVSLITAEIALATGRPRVAVQSAVLYGLANGILGYRSQSHVCTWYFQDGDDSLAVTEVVRRPPLPLTGSTSGASPALAF